MSYYNMSCGSVYFSNFGSFLTASKGIITPDIAYNEFGYNEHPVKRADFFSSNELTTMLKISVT